MLKILVNAYACCPDMGSEQGMSWHFIKRIAERCEVFVITESEYRQKNMEAVTFDVNDSLGTNRHGLTRELCGRIHFTFVDVGKDEEECRKIRGMCWHQGNWGFYVYYSRWQRKAAQKAREIIHEQELTGHGIDLMHQLNMAGFREPGLLYQINEERVVDGKHKIPLVWGPMTGYGSIPFSFMRPGGVKFTAFYLLKNLLNDVQLLLHPRVRRMIRASDKLLAATPEMREGVRKYYAMEVEHMNETGCVDVDIHYDNEVVTERRNRQAFKVIWVGRFIYTKQLRLALKTIARIRSLEELEFHVVGRGFADSDMSEMQSFADSLGIGSVCHWHGQIANIEVQRLMRDSDVFFFTSIFEATSTVILEAIQNRLPVVCFDRCGFGPVVDESIGVKIDCVSPKKAVEDFAEAITYLYNHREVLEKMRSNCVKKQRLLSWNSKIERLMEIYEELVKKNKNGM